MSLVVHFLLLLAFQFWLVACHTTRVDDDDANKKQANRQLLPANRIKSKASVTNITKRASCCFQCISPNAEFNCEIWWKTLSSKILSCTAGLCNVSYGNLTFILSTTITSTCHNIDINTFSFITYVGWLPINYCPPAPLSLSHRPSPICCCCRLR